MSGRPRETAGPISAFGDAAIDVPARDARHARRLCRALSRLPFTLECVVGWDRVLVHLVDGVTTDRALPAIEACVARDERDREHDSDRDHEPEPRTHVVRAIYDGPDLAEVAAACGFAPEEVARRHAAATYEVEVVGFLPGFAYLGGVDPTIARPRRATPRTRVPALSIGLAGARTAIYPLASPGGWNLLGRVVGFAPFDPSRSPPSPLAVGDRVRFAIEDVR